MERSSSRSTIEATMRLFLLRSLNSCSDLLNSPPFKALPLFEKPHVRAAPSRFAHSAPKQGHRASRAFANPTIGFALGIIPEQSPLLQELHLLSVCQPHKMLICSGGSRAISAQRRRSRWGLSPKCEPWPTPGDPRPCPQLRVEIPGHAITVVTGVSGSGKALWFWTP